MCVPKHTLRSNLYEPQSPILRFVWWRRLTRAKPRDNKFPHSANTSEELNSLSLSLSLSATSFPLPENAGQAPYPLHPRDLVTFTVAEYATDFNDLFG